MARRGVRRRLPHRRRRLPRPDARRDRQGAVRDDEGAERPVAVLTVRDVDLTVSFPNPVFITGINGALRAEPARLARDPYGVGWLFERRRDRAAVPNGPEGHRRLRSGDDATPWMLREWARLRARSPRRQRAARRRLIADGGLPAPPRGPSRTRSCSTFPIFFSPPRPRRELVVKLPARDVRRRPRARPRGGMGPIPRLQYRTVEQPIQFNHKVHSEAVGMTCDDCHPSVPTDASPAFPISTCAVPRREGEQRGRAAPRRALRRDGARGAVARPRAAARERLLLPRAAHRAKIACERCHGPHGESPRRAPVQENRLTWYSRDIWGPSPTRPRGTWEGMKMTDCSSCHRAAYARACLTATSERGTDETRSSPAATSSSPEAPPSATALTPIPWNLPDDLAIWTQNCRWPEAAQPGTDDERLRSARSAPPPAA